MIHLEYQTLIHNNFKVQGQQVALCDALFFFLSSTNFNKLLLTATYNCVFGPDWLFNNASYKLFHRYRLILINNECNIERGEQ